VADLRELVQHDSIHTCVTTYSYVYLSTLTPNYNIDMSSSLCLSLSRCLSLSLSLSTTKTVAKAYVTPSYVILNSHLQHRLVELSFSPFRNDEDSRKGVRDSFLRVTRLKHLCTRLVYVCVVTHSCVCRDSFMCVSGSMPHGYASHDSFTCVS